MNIQQVHNKGEKGRGGEEKAKQSQSTNQNSSSIVTSSSPPSSSTSPSHEFSFTISLHPSSSVLPSKTKSSPASFAIDLSPADEIFFHGHLLPLTLLSHLPISPRASTNSSDNITLPVKDLTEDHKHKDSNSNNNDNLSNINNVVNGRRKVKSFTIFGFSRWRREREKEEEEMKKKRKMRFNVGHVIKRYIRLVRPLLIFRGRRDNRQARREPCSYSGHLSWKGKQELRGRRGEFSAPASLWTSPTNSGPLVASSSSISSSASDSTMEELQSAIQAAIAHCKNSSLAVKGEKLKIRD
ncbi:hypothetical protein GIB67_017627 [Kingdonia uniflora]|uniref:BRI1 kinase inhibitor 1 n=1 Tax=Kingdonia uniflora TaxID=39325 RepID=A0A7J7LN81_9MAGN|nr:hypothetical protein GIB67_017627 [Kingdonia uniflora]